MFGSRADMYFWETKSMMGESNGLFLNSWCTLADYATLTGIIKACTQKETPQINANWMLWLGGKTNATFSVNLTRTRCNKSYIFSDLDLDLTQQSYIYSEFDLDQTQQKLHFQWIWLKPGETNAAFSVNLTGTRRNQCYMFIEFD